MGVDVGRVEKIGASVMGREEAKGLDELQRSAEVGGAGYKREGWVG